MDDDYIKALHILPDYHQIRALWVDVGYNEDQLAQKEADVVSQVRSLVSNLLFLEKSNHSKMATHRVDLEKQISQLRAKLKMKPELPSPRGATLAQQIETLSNSHANLLELEREFNQLNELSSQLGVHVPILDLNKPTALSLVRMEIEKKFKMIEQRESTIQSLVAKIQKKPTLLDSLPKKLSRDSVLNYTPGILGYSEETILALLSVFGEDDSSISDESTEDTKKVESPPKPAPRVAPQPPQKVKAEPTPTKSLPKPPLEKRRPESTVLAPEEVLKIAVPKADSAETIQAKQSARIKKMQYATEKVVEAVFVPHSEQKLKPVIDNAKNLFFQEDLVKELSSVTIIDKPDLYRERFYGRVHYNFVAKNKTKEGDQFIFSILGTSLDGFYYTLVTDKKGTQFSKVATTAINAKAIPDSTFKDTALAWLTDTYPNYAFYHVFQTQFPSELLAVEPKHPQKKSTIKIAFLYSKGTEGTLQDFFNNKEVSPSYMQFLDRLGDKMNLKGWKKYRGDFGAEIVQDSYYSSWKGIEVMFHICHWLTPEQHRRLIGNDVVVIIFHDGPNAFIPDPVSAIGTVPQIFGVVSPHEEGYRVAFFSRPNIKAYPPHIPIDHVFAPDQLKDFLFTKAYNGYCQALTCPPMNRLYELPRGEEILNLINAFPQCDEKYIKKMEENQKRRLELLAASAKGDPLMLLCTVQQLTPTRTQTIKNAYVQVSLCQQECMTKKSETGNFNEVLVFFLAGINPAINFIEVKMFDYTYIDQIASWTEIASTQLCFIDICQNLATSITLTLRYPSYVLYGTLQLSFKLTGPGSNLCSKCGFFLGLETALTCESHYFHQQCVSCETCRTRLSGTEYKIKDSGTSLQFFCNKCYDKKFGDDSDFKKSDAMVQQTRPGKEFDHPHTFEKASSVAPLSKCGFCNDYLKGGKGIQCSVCRYLCHKECQDFVPEDCMKQMGTGTTDSEIKKGYRKSISRVKSFSGMKSNKIDKSGDKSDKNLDLSSVQISSPVMTSTTFEGFPPADPSPTEMGQSGKRFSKKTITPSDGGNNKKSSKKDKDKAKS